MKSPLAVIEEQSAIQRAERQVLEAAQALERGIFSDVDLRLKLVEAVRRLRTVRG